MLHGQASRIGKVHESRSHWIGHFGPGGRTPAARAGAGHAVRGGSLLRRPHPHRGCVLARCAWPNRDARGGHRLSGVQRAHLPRLDRAAGRVAGAHGRVGHVVFRPGAGRGRVGRRGAGVERLQPGHRVCPASQPAAPALFGHAVGAAALQPPVHRAGRQRPGTGAGAAAGRVFGPAWLWRGVSPLVFPAHAGLYLELPDRPDAALSRGHHGALLPQPRPDPGAEPAAVAHRGGRGAAVCACHPGRPGCAAANPCRAHRAQCRRCIHPHWQRRGALRCRGAGRTQRPGLAPAGAAQRRRAAGVGRHPLPAQPRRTAHRHPRDARAPRRLGGMELRARSQRHAGVRPRLPALLAQPPAAAAVCAAGAGVAQPRARHRPGAGAGRVRLRPPGVRPGGAGRAKAAAAAARRAAHLVCGRMDGLWLS